MIIAGIAAMDHFTGISTIRQNGTSMFLMVTRFEPSAMELSPFALLAHSPASQPLCSTIGSLAARGRDAAFKTEVLDELDRRH